MNAERAIDAALEALRLPARRGAAELLSRGASGVVARASCGDGVDRVAKILPATRAAALGAEDAGLAALAATRTVRTPARLGLVERDGWAVLLLEHLPRAVADEAAWRRAGVALAQLHDAPTDRRYGLATSNFLGAAPQPNDPADDWVAFVRERRLGAQLELGRRSGAIDRALALGIERLLPRLGDVLPARPRPALLHGDLWSGNLVPFAAPHGPGIALVDPAVFVGDRWYEFGIMDLFGGVPSALRSAYADATAEPAPDDERGLVYRLHHLLNHLNLFGSGYRAACAALLARLPGGG